MKVKRLFATLPAASEVATSLGPQPLPYTVSSGHTVLITGTGDLASVKLAMLGEAVHPVVTTSGRAALGVFLCRFDQASSGPHLELHLGALATAKPGAVISDAPEAFLAAFATHPDWGFLSLSLYNDDPGVVALNDEYFGLDAKLMAGEISISETRVEFELTHSDGTPLARGQIARRKSPELASIWRLARLMGWRAFLAAGRAPFAAAHVINRKGSVLQTNRRALTLTSADERAVMRWQAKRDQMTLALPHDFQPKAMQHLNPFRFAYLHPDVAG